jgi:hypothetical protein
MNDCQRVSILLQEAPRVSVAIVNECARDLKYKLLIAFHFHGKRQERIEFWIRELVLFFSSELWNSRSSGGLKLLPAVVLLAPLHQQKSSEVLLHSIGVTAIITHGTKSEGVPTL